MFIQTAKAKMQELSSEVQRKEDWLQEERMEREKLEAELGRHREHNRVIQCERGHFSPAGPLVSSCKLNLSETTLNIVYLVLSKQ